MPVVELHVLEGYNSQEKQRLGQALMMSSGSGLAAAGLRWMRPR